MQFQLHFYDTRDDNKYMAETEHRHVIFGNQLDIWTMWHILHRQDNKKHVEVYDLMGNKQKPEEGLNGLCFTLP